MNLKNELIVTIARYSPYSIDDVRRAYDRLQSFDALLKMVVHAAQLGFSSLNIYLDDLGRARV